MMKLQHQQTVSKTICSRLLFTHVQQITKDIKFLMFYFLEISRKLKNTEKKRHIEEQKNAGPTYWTKTVFNQTTTSVTKQINYWHKKVLKNYISIFVYTLT